MGCRDMAIFRFFVMVAVHHIGFVMGIFGQSMMVVCITLQNLVGIDTVVSTMWTLA